MNYGAAGSFEESALIYIEKEGEKTAQKQGLR